MVPMPSTGFVERSIPWLTRAFANTDWVCNSKRMASISPSPSDA